MKPISKKKEKWIITKGHVFLPERRKLKPEGNGKDFIKMCIDIAINKARLDAEIEKIESALDLNK